jgi:hypothetical protein
VHGPGSTAELGLDDGEVGTVESLVAARELSAQRADPLEEPAEGWGGLILVAGGGTLLWSTSGLPAATTLPHADCHHSGRVASVTESGAERESV